jgi:hypothetical protein
MPSDAPAALPSRPDTSRRYVLPFVASLVAFVAVGATLGGYGGGDVAHMREIAEWAMSDKPAEDDVAGDLLRHPSRYLDVSTVAPGVYAAHAVAVSGGAVTVRAEPEMSERDRRKDADTEKVEGTDGQKLESYEPQRASRADREKTEHRDASGEPSGAAASADRDGKDLSAEEIARRERRYRRYLDRHGYKPIREVLEQIERPAPSDAPGPAPAAPSDPGRSDSRSP